MNLTKNLAKAVATVATSLALVGITAGNAHADWSGSLVSADGGASVSWLYHSYTATVTGTLTDRKPGDAMCARVYSQGYNWVRGWGGWNLEKTVCGGGSASFHHQPIVYSDKIDLIVCTGYGQCMRQRVKG